MKSSLVYKDAQVTVTAFPTKHAMESYGDRFDTPDRSIVISGDTNPTEETIKACNRCDVLIHEARTLELFATLPEHSHSGRRITQHQNSWPHWPPKPSLGC